MVLKPLSPALSKDSKYPSLFLFLFLVFSFTSTCLGGITGYYYDEDGNLLGTDGSTDRGETYVVTDASKNEKIELPDLSARNLISDLVSNNKSAETGGVVYSKDASNLPNNVIGAYHIHPGAKDALGNALSNLRSAYDKKIYLNAVKKRSDQNKLTESNVSDKIAAFENNRFNEYTAKLAGIYIRLANNSEANEEIVDLFGGYLNGNDFFAERLRLEIDKQRNLVSEANYQLKLTQMPEHYMTETKFTELSNNPRLISSFMVLTCDELDNVERELTIYENITAVAKDWLPFVMFLITFRNTKLTEKSLEIAIQNANLAKRSYELAEQNYNLAKQKEDREVVTAKNLTVEPKKRRIGFLSL